MKRPTILATLFLLLIVCSASFAGEISLVGTTDKDPLAYAPGETMTFSVQLYEDDVPLPGRNLTWTRTGDDGETATGTAVSSADEPLKITTSIDVPGFVRVQVFLLDENGSPIQGEQNQFNGGAGVRLDEIKGYPEPNDFDDFWNRQKKRLDDVPMRADLTEVESGDPNVAAFDVKIDCPASRPVSGYFCKPKNAAPKSLPAFLSFHGYGVYSAGKDVAGGRDRLRFEINAHGIENGRPESYYQELRDGELKGYGFDEKENSDPETCYWNGMMLRLMRALEFLKTQPEWDGETLIVMGGSQGGFQALAAAGLDADVSECIAYIPWFCDLSGNEKSGRLDGWAPKWVDGLGYYDAANHAKRIKAATKIYVGLGDYICPPSGEMVLFNNLTAPTTLEFFQGKTHGFNMKSATPTVLTKP